MTRPAEVLAKHRRGLHQRLKGLSQPAAWTYAGLVVVAWAVLAMYCAATATGAGSFAVGFLASVASLAVGAFTGFLFGIPRSIAEPSGSVGSSSGARRSSERYRANTNLEQISDWLTKILVGVGLVQLSSISGGLSRLIGNVAGGLNPTPSASDNVVAACLLVYFAIVGFVAGYLATRTMLLRLFERAEQVDLEALLREADRAVTDWLQEKDIGEQQLREALSRAPDWYQGIVLDRARRATESRTGGVAARADRLITIVAEIGG